MAPQTSYLQNAIQAQPGVLFGNDASARDVVSRICAVDIPFGRHCELNSSGLAVPTQDTGTTTTFLPQALGISLIGEVAVEQIYQRFQVPTALAGTISVTNASASVTFSTAQTLAAGTQLVFASQPGVIYYLSTALAAATAGTLTTVYTGTTAGSTTTTVIGVSSSVPGWRAGSVVPFLRKGRIWVETDGGGTTIRYGAVNLRHSSTGANPQGVFTFTAAQTTAGNEIDVAPGVTVWNPDLIGGTTGPTFTDSFGNTFKTLPVEINI